MTEKMGLEMGTGTTGTIITIEIVKETEAGIKMRRLII